MRVYLCKVVARPNCSTKHIGRASVALQTCMCQKPGNLNKIMSGSDNNSSDSHSVNNGSVSDVTNPLNWVGSLTDVHPSDIPVKIKDIQDRLHRSLLRQWRQAITGDSERYKITPKVAFYK